VALGLKLPLLAILKSFTIEFCFLGFAAFGTALRLVLKTLFSVEFLFTFGEDKFFVAVLADNGFVGHFVSPVFFWDRTFLGFPETQGIGTWEC
jgi:hypothetical protein